MRDLRWALAPTKLSTLKCAVQPGLGSPCSDAEHLCMLQTGKHDFGTASPACDTLLQPNAGVSLLQDGTIKYEIKLTGELSTNLPNPEEGASSPYGTMVLPGVNAQHHQHMFCARLDMAVDDAEGGRGLLVTEVGHLQGPASWASYASPDQLYCAEPHNS